jgi:cell division septation protein DedD
MAVRRTRRAAAGTALAAMGVGLIGSAAVMLLGGPAQAVPPGNNGTIKIDDVAFDDHPNNEPHVGCVFQVDFYGYDEGDLSAHVIFESHPPTEPSGEVLLEDEVFIGEDDNSGGGSEAGLDASETYTLDFTGFEPHPIQGFHVKLTIHAEGSQGADVKHKVFWVQPCVETPPPTTSTPPPPPTTTTAPPPPTTTTAPPPETTPPTTTTAPPPETTPPTPPVTVPTAVEAGLSGGDNSGSGSSGMIAGMIAGGLALTGAGFAVAFGRRGEHQA